MSTRQPKHCGEPVDSRQARKRRMLVASNTGGASEAEPVDPRESAVEEVIDLTDRSSEPEVSDLTDDNSVVQWQQSQQYPRFFRAADNSAVLLMSDNEEEQGDYDDIWPAGPASSLFWVDEDSEEQSQQYPRFFRAADNSAVLLMSDDEEELRDNNGTWPASLFSSLLWVDEDSQQWQQSQQYPRFFRAADNSAVLLMSDNEEEQGDYDDIWPAGPASSLFWVDEDSEVRIHMSSFLLCGRGRGRAVQLLSYVGCYGVHRGRNPFHDGSGFLIVLAVTDRLQILQTADLVCLMPTEQPTGILSSQSLLWFPFFSSCYLTQSVCGYHS
ncbi:uncharacterized protein LOC135412966 isoform X1 [Pseudopipra pipra]|uniref:uncharacterized protein LOC135412966 isoform X1 n=1 Tax=Pseudopipra pipra TaxID=415032 RepID=UPI00313A1356